MADGGCYSIFQIWESVGQRVPFKVRRYTWSPARWVEIRRVDCVRDERRGYSGKVYTDTSWYSDFMRSGGIDGLHEVCQAGCFHWNIFHL